MGVIGEAALHQTNRSNLTAGHELIQKTLNSLGGQLNTIFRIRCHISIPRCSNVGTVYARQLLETVKEPYGISYEADRCDPHAIHRVKRHPHPVGSFSSHWVTRSME
jgi:hypothetical protein